MLIIPEIKLFDRSFAGSKIGPWKSLCNFFFEALQSSISVDKIYQNIFGPHFSIQGQSDRFYPWRGKYRSQKALILAYPVKNPVKYREVRFGENTYFDIFYNAFVPVNKLSTVSIQVRFNVIFKSMGLVRSILIRSS